MLFAIVTLIILIIINAFFAASEIALIGLNEIKVKKMADEGNKKAKMLHNLIKEPSRFLSTIQIGITLAGFLASAFAADFFAEPLAKALNNMGIPLSVSVLQTISVVVITILLSYFTLVFGELVPKQLALQKAEAIANFAVAPLSFLFTLTLPLVKVLTFSTNAIVRLFGVDPNAEPEEATEEEIRMMVDIGGERGTIEHFEKLMINNIFEFNDKYVSDIITHRTDMTTLPIDASLEETLAIVREKGFTRFPVWDGDIDNIVGILHVKDLFHFINTNDDEPFHLKNVIRKPYFVLETLSIDELLIDMQKNNVHIAIVLDEYGGTEGMVTIEDVIEEIVGEISSESNDIGVIEEDLRKIAPNVYEVEGTYHLWELEEELNINLPSEDFDTVNGFLINQLGYIPSEGEHPVITYNDCIFEVKEIGENRIEKVLITLPEEKVKQPTTDDE